MIQSARGHTVHVVITTAAKGSKLLSVKACAALSDARRLAKRIRKEMSFEPTVEVGIHFCHIY